MQTKKQEDCVPARKKQYEQKFCKQWLQDPRLSDWLVEQRDASFCKPCNKYLRSRKFTLLNHAASTSHKQCVENVKVTKCRVCLEDKDSKFMPRLDSQESTTKMEIRALLRVCGGIRMYENSFPECICLDCMKRLLDAYQFRNLCQSSARQYNNAICDDDCALQQEIAYADVDADGDADTDADVEVDDKSYILQEGSVPFSDEEDCIELVVPGEHEEEETEPNELTELNFVEESQFHEMIIDHEQPESEPEIEQHEQYHIQDMGWTTVQEEEAEIVEEEQVADLIVIKEETPTIIYDSPALIFEPPAQEPIVVEYTSVTTNDMHMHDRAVKQPLFICETCGNQYDKAFKLKSHLKSHLKIKPFKCEICEKTFAMSGQLKAHMRTHTGEKPYECGFCGRKFADYGAKHRHERSVHLRQKNYTCDECGKAFSYAVTLKNHRKVHTGEKPFECIPCGKAFVDNGHLKTHCTTIMHRERLTKLLNEDSKSFD